MPKKPHCTPSASGPLRDIRLEWSHPSGTQKPAPEPYDAVVQAALAEVDNLRTALASSREIGAAVGILMERFKLSYDDGFEWLRQASQRRNTRVADLANELVLTGLLEEHPSSGRSWGDCPGPAQ